MEQKRKKRIIQGLPAGFKDYLPEEMIPRQKMLDTIRAVFELHGFLPLDTPSIERLKVLTGGDKNFSKQIFKTSKMQGDDVLALRFDLTVPLARVVAQYQELKKPFKRYQMGKVWRGEKPQAGRLREFMQCDADIVGAASIAADAEIISLAYRLLSSLGIEKFTIHVNSRKVLNALPNMISFPERKLLAVLRAIDKFDKVGARGVREVLKNDAKLSEQQTENIVSFIRIKIFPKQDFSEAFGKYTSFISEGIKELETLRVHLRALGVPDETWMVNCSIARGLGYYTGTIFETTLNDISGIGSVCSGGRYDGLVGQFNDVFVPAVGISLGLDRLFFAMTQYKIFKEKHATADVIFLNFDEAELPYIETITSELRKEGIATEIYFGNEDTIKGQLAYALNREIPIILIAGSDEKTRGTVQVKDVVSRTQEEIKKENLIQTIRRILQKKNI